MIAPPSAVLQIRQDRRATFRALTAERVAVIRVRSGVKHITVAGRAFDVAAGGVAVLPARLPLTVENQPAAGGLYLTTALVLSDALVTDLRGRGLEGGDPFAVSRDDRALAAFERAATAVDDPLLPEALKAHAVAEVLLWLAEAGFGFGPERPARFCDRLRGLIAEAPAADWKSGDAARALAVSEATLRRRLAAEGTSFADLLADVRMSSALGLLQTTRLPINRVALDVGYASPSRFAVRFRKRFGIAPSLIRGGVERNGTEDARLGTDAG
jgi:AraC-like DNA-binding protein